MGDYTPTTDTVQATYAVHHSVCVPCGEEAVSLVAEFDRWLRSERLQQARFWARVTKEYHWLWMGETATNGYGRADIDGRNQAAHRVSYEWLVGPIPDGLELDHLCGVRNCVNPAHLEPVTHQENVSRAASTKTHCQRGHELAGTNLVPSSLRKGRRDCLTCSRLRAREYREKKRAEIEKGEDV